MSRRVRPAIDRAFVPAHGVTREGQPLSYNRAPAPDVAPWIGRLYAARVQLPENHRLDCGMFNEAAMLRIQLSGEWVVHTADGPQEFGPETLLFGPHTRRMPVSVTGSFVSVGYSMRPGASLTLRGPRLLQVLDRVTLPQQPDPKVQRLLTMLDPANDEESLLQILENWMRRWVSTYDCQQPDPITVKFEQLTFTDPKMPIPEFAERCGVAERTIERIVNRDFGMSPKQVLRRARALDMASVLRGVADADEADELALRYYDQSHQIREFTELFGMSPRQFAATPQPLMTLGLEVRQARRLEELERIAPGGVRPWE
jgi:AraC-like DNA-binding protein